MGISEEAAEKDAIPEAADAPVEDTTTSPPVEDVVQSTSRMDVSEAPASPEARRLERGKNLGDYSASSRILSQLWVF